MTSQDRIKKVKKAIELVKKASQELDGVGLFGDEAYFKQQLNEILSCDNGEAGLINFLKVISNLKNPSFRKELTKND